MQIPIPLTLEHCVLLALGIAIGLVIGYCKWGPNESR